MAGRIAYYGNIVTSGLVLNLDAAKKDSYSGSGTTWRDISGNSYNGILTNGPTYNTDNGGIILLDGVNDYINVNRSNILGNNFTVSAWIKLNTGFGVLMNVFSGGYDATWYPAIYGSKTGWYTGTNWRVGTTTFVANRWYQVTFRLDNSTGSPRHAMYVNGIREYIGTDTFTGGGVIDIGKIIGQSDRYLNGSMGIFQAYNIALTDEQIFQNYNATKTRY